METTITATRQVVEDYQRLFVNRRAFTMQSVQPHPETGRHYYFRPSKKGTDIRLLPTQPTTKSAVRSCRTPILAPTLTGLIRCLRHRAGPANTE